MWIFITTRLRRWLIFAIVVPLATTVVHLIRTTIERRAGETALTRTLTKVENLGQRRSRGKRS